MDCRSQTEFVESEACCHEPFLYFEVIDRLSVQARVARLAGRPHVLVARFAAGRCR